MCTSGAVHQGPCPTSQLQCNKMAVALTGVVFAAEPRLASIFDRRRTKNATAAGQNRDI